MGRFDMGRFDGKDHPKVNPGVIKRAMEIVNDSEIRITPRDFTCRLAKDAGISMQEAKRALKHLVDINEFAYSYDLGATQVEPSFDRPVRVTDHFVLSPWRSNPAAPLIEILLLPGISFGSGKHPTTRLCLEAIDRAILGAGFPEPAFPLPADDVSPPVKSGRTNVGHYARTADVGTGSGVLALAMIKAGCDSCLALDTDLNSASEAMQNVALNGLERQIEVTTDALEPSSHSSKDSNSSNSSNGSKGFHCSLGSQETFDLIAANLRFPTLNDLAPLFQTLLDARGLLIFSGIKPYELDNLICHYSDHSFTPVWTKTEKSWAALVLKKKWKP
jgi:ribosomal protein L11 methyltransferase